MEQMSGSGRTAADDSAAFGRALSFYRQFAAGTAKQRARLVAKAPLADLQTAALRHPDPFTRRDFLGFLDHYANDESMAVFDVALRDPIDFVRNIALHSIACEACKSADLCVADVVPGLVAVLENDPSPDLRTKCIPTLLRLGAADPRARPAVEHAADSDADPLV